MRHLLNAILDQRDRSSKMIYIDRRGNDAVFSVVYTRSMRAHRADGRRRSVRYFIARVLTFLTQAL